MPIESSRLQSSVSDSTHVIESAKHRVVLNAQPISGHWGSGGTSCAKFIHGNEENELPHLPPTGKRRLMSSVGFRLSG